MTAIVTLRTIINCAIPVYFAPNSGAPGSDVVFVQCGADVPHGCVLNYRYDVQRGCSYSVYDDNNACVDTRTFEGRPGVGERGGGFVVASNMRTIEFCNVVSLQRIERVAVADLISNVSDVVALRNKLLNYRVSEKHTQAIIDIYLDGVTHGTIIPVVLPSSVTLLDQSTGGSYMLYVSDGVLMMQDSANGPAPSAYVNLVDSVTGTKYAICVSDGKLTMNEANQQLAAAEYLSLADQVTNMECRLLVTNNILQMEVAW